MNEIVNEIYKDYMKILSPYIGNDTTYSDDLRKKGKKIFGNKFLGVFASDEIPNLKNGQMYIANLDTSNEPGSHWIAVYKKNNKNYVYDSYGRKSRNIFNSIFKKGGNVKDTQYDAEQDENENNCGLRSIVALYMFKEFDPDIVAKYL